MANTRIKDISTAATTLNSDDFIAVDGSTAGTRKMAKADLITEVSTGVSGTYLEESNNLSDVASKDTSKLNLEVPDVGTAPNEVPLNSMLSGMAYMSPDSVAIDTLEVTDKVSGTLNIATASPEAIADADADDLVIGDGVLTNFGATIATNSSGQAKINFADGAGANAARGQIKYDHQFDKLSVSTAGAERVVVDEYGRTGIGTSSPSAGAVGGKVVHVQSSGETASVRVDRSDASTAGTLSLTAGNSTLGVYGTGSKDIAFSTNGTERVRIDSLGALDVKSVGGASAAQFPSAASVNGITALPSAIGTPFLVGRDTGSLRSAHFAGHLKFDSGYGIDFGAVATSAGDGTGTTGTVSNQVFSDYEFGSWVPTFATTGVDFTTMTVEVVAAQYVKVGRVVHCQAYLRTDNVDATGASGTVVVDGLPFVSDTTADNFSTLNVGYSASWVNAPAAGYLQPNAAYVRLTRYSTTGASTITPSDLTAGASADKNTLIFSLSYIAST